MLVLPVMVGIKYWQASRQLSPGPQFDFYGLRVDTP